MNAPEVAAGRPIEPEHALRQIAYLRGLVEATRLRAADAYGFFILWGIIWALGYVVTAWARSDLSFLPELDGRYIGITWAALTALGWLITAVFAKRFFSSRPASSLGKQLFRMNLALLVALHAFWQFGFNPTSNAALNAYWPLWAGVAYVLNSFFLGRELAVIGGWLLAAGVASLFMPADVGALWLAVAGGGSLAVTGFVFRRQVRG